MLTAKQKRKENITGYILYMFQVEDLIRACRFDSELIDKHLIEKYRVDDNTRKEIAGWYYNLMIMMEKEGICEKGHLQFLTNQINELNEFHLRLMETKTDMDYVRVFQSVSGLITELNIRNNTEKNDLHITLDAVYGFLLLKMQHKSITAATTEAIQRLTGWLNLLSDLFRDFESGKLEFNNDELLQ